MSYAGVHYLDSPSLILTLLVNPFPIFLFLETALVRVFTQPTFNPSLDHSLLQQRLGFP